MRPTSTRHNDSLAGASLSHKAQQSQYSWRGALIACGLTAIGMPMDFAMAHNVPGMPIWPALMSTATGAVLAIVLLLHRRHPTIRVSMTVFMLNNAVILVALWITAGAYAAAPGRWIPFQANNLARSRPRCCRPTC